MRYFDFPCDTWEYIYHTNYGFFTSKRKTDDNDKLVVAPNYNLFHNKYLHFQAIVSPLMMNKNLLDDEGEDQCDEDQHDEEDTPAVYHHNIAIGLWKTKYEGTDLDKCNTRTLLGRAREKLTKMKKPGKGVHLQILCYLFFHLHVYKKAKRVRIERNHIVNDLVGRN